MLISATMAGHDPDARTIFDGLVEFARDHPSEIDSRLMDWSVAADEVPDANGNDSAFDGDADIAYALLLAEQQWGAGGRFDYGALAAQLLAGILASEIGPESRLPMLGDWVAPGGAVHSQWSPRVSDFLPDHFLAFQQATADSTWLTVRAETRASLESVQLSFAPATGLVPDFLQPMSALDTTPRPADPHFLESQFDGAYYYNSTRVPLRLGIAALLDDDLDARAQVARLSLWAEVAAAGDPALIRAGYALDGSPLAGSAFFTTAFAAPLAVAAMCVPSQQQWLDDLYDAVHLSDEDYYEDTLSLLALLTMSGNLWSPATAEPMPVPALTPGALALQAALLIYLGRVGARACTRC